MTTAPTREKPLAWGHKSDHASADVRPSFRSQRPKCPDCGGIVLLAAHARFDLAGRIEHVWSCDDCGNQFVTSISPVRPLVV